MKTVRFGYDGKGQKKITSSEEVEPHTFIRGVR